VIFRVWINLRKLAPSTNAIINESSRKRRGAEFRLQTKSSPVK